MSRVFILPNIKNGGMMMNQQPTDELKRSLGFWSAISIVIGTIIGSGIFFKQGSVLDSAGTSTLAIAAWVFGGIITLTGGLTVAEIGAQMPYTGGLYVYIENLYGRLLGFLAGWMQVIVYGPAIIASVAGFMSILMANFFGLGTQWRIPLAVITVIAIGVMNLFENKVGAIFSIITTAGKMIPIAAIIIFGLFWGHQDAFGQTVTEIHQSTGGFGVAVLATLLEDGYRIEDLLPYLNTIPQVLGRAERIDCGQNFNVIVDYAHTPDGYEKIFEYINSIAKENGRIITVFGAHGARDHKKRPMIGKIVDDNSDVIILCSEDNHWENPYDICCEIATGISKHSWIYIEDRYDAIRQGLELANKDDTVCILGKADEQYFKIGDGKVYWMGDDNAAREILNNMRNGEENEEIK